MSSKKIPCCGRVCVCNIWTDVKLPLTFGASDSVVAIFGPIISFSVKLQGAHGHLDGMGQRRPIQVAVQTYLHSRFFRNGKRLNPRTSKSYLQLPWAITLTQSTFRRSRRRIISYFIFSPSISPMFLCLFGNPSPKHFFGISTRWSNSVDSGLFSGWLIQIFFNFFVKYLMWPFCI